MVLEDLKILPIVGEDEMDPAVDPMMVPDEEEETPEEGEDMVAEEGSETEDEKEEGEDGDNM